MTKKEQLLEIINHAIVNHDYMAVAIETRGNKEIEIIINPKCNLIEKWAYYEKAYNDNMVLNTYDGIKIVSACAFDSDTELADICSSLLKKF